MDCQVVIFLEIATFMSNHDQQTQNHQLVISEWPFLHEWPIYVKTNALVIVYNWSLVILSWSLMTNTLFINEQLLILYEWPILRWSFFRAVPKNDQFTWTLGPIESFAVHSLVQSWHIQKMALQNFFFCLSFNASGNVFA